MNNNSFIALSFIKEVENPYEIFCDYIEYTLLTDKSHSLGYEKLITQFKEHSGLNIPHYIFNYCLKIMFSSNKIVKTNYGTLYKLSKSTLDLKSFQLKKKILENQEKELIEDLMDFSHKNFGKDWDYSNARKALSSFLMIEDNIHSIYIDSKINKNYIENTDEWILQKYIKYLLDVKNYYYDYLMDIMKGLALYVGTLYTNPNENNYSLIGTDFYLDTKLILRFLGYTTEIYQQTVTQLVDIIKNEYKGNICVFSHNVQEVKSALYNAHIALKNGNDIDDNELRMHQKLKNKDSNDFKVDSDSVEYELEVHEIRIQPKIQWTDTSCWINNIKQEVLFNEIKKSRKIFKEQSISNDVDAINQINMLRNGDYSVHFGGVNSLPIIITNNTPLIRAIKNFIIKDTENDSSSTWNIGKMPIISDTALMCKLWANAENKKDDIPILLFSRNAYSILPFDDSFFSNLKERSKNLKEKYNCKIFSLSNERLEKIESLIIQNNNGNIESLSDDDLIYTIKESYEKDKLALKDEVKSRDEVIIDQEEIIKQKNKIIESKDLQLISVYGTKYLDKLGINVLPILFSKYWWIISTVVLAILNLSIPKINTSNEINVILKVFFISIPSLCKIAIELLKKIVAKPKVINWIHDKFVVSVYKKYVQNIKNNLLPEESVFEKEIIQYCTNNSKNEEEKELVQIIF